MQVVIDIDERLYEIITNPKNLPTMYHASRCADAVRNGVPLPKGHGKLIDADELAKAMFYGYMCDKTKSHTAKFVMSVAKSLVDLQKPIIEADMSSVRKGTPLEENESGYNCENWIP